MRKFAPTHSHDLKRWFTAIAAGVLSACLILPSGMAFAESDDSNTFDDGILTYTILNSTQVSVTSCGTSATHVSIMPSIDGYEIVSIGEEAFANCESLQALTIPSTVTEIGSAAFYGCTSLESLTIPDAVTEIEDGTFFNCTALTELNLGNAVTSIGTMAFGYCTALETITLPDTLESVGDQLFYYCSSLETVEIPASLTELGSYTFYGCLSMKSFNIPATLEDFGALSFVACPSLETITVEDGNPNFVEKDNAVYSTGENILYVYPAGRSDTSFTVPDDVLVIYAGAFFAAGNLESLTLNEGLQYIGEMAFDFCRGITSLTIPESVTTIGSTAFSDCTSLTQLTFAGAEDGDADSTGEALEIADYAFFCCDSLKAVTLPKRVSSIGDYAFGCTIPEDDDTSENIVTVDSDSGDSFSVKPIDGFVLTGYTGAASDYAKNCQADVDFKYLDFNWKGFAFWAVLVAAVLVVIFVAVCIIRKSMMTKEERLALRAAQEEQDKAEAQEEAEFDDGYRSIVDEDEPEAVASYEETLTHGMTHSYGHGELAEAQENRAESE